MNPSFRILVINPGSTSTKIALYEGRVVQFLKSVRHSSDDLARFDRIAEQYAFRKEMILHELSMADVALTSLDAVIGRGGLIRPVESGVFEMNSALEHDLLTGVQGEHASNLGGLIALDIARSCPGVRAFIADPVVVDELSDVARLSGLPQMPRRSIFHALNQKAVARRYARMLHRPYEALNLIVAHLGGGISIGVHQQGRVVDVNNALDGFGPFSPERAGTLPSGALVDLCFSGTLSRDEVKRLINGRGGLMAHLGTSSVPEVMERVKQGDTQARLVLDAMLYQVAKSIGACATVVCGKVDGIILTGGMAQSDALMNQLRDRIEFLAPVVVFPGEDEMAALAENALGVLEGIIACREYH